MRAEQFLNEYNMAKTAQHFGSKLLDAAAKDISLQIADIRQALETDQRLTPEQEQRLIAELLKRLEDADPTPNKKYMVWLAKMYAGEGYQSNMEDMMSTVKEYLAKFDKLNARRMLPSPRNDIMKYSDIGSFMSVLDEYPSPFKDEEIDRGEAETVFENDRVRIVIPRDRTAACYYGQGTRWCTAARQSTNYFDSYNRDGPLYILLPKRPNYEGEKYQLHFPSEQFMDEQDRSINIVEILERRFGDLIPFFKEQMPEGYFNDWIMLASDEDLREPLMQIGEIAMEHIWEIVHDWEISDDYYYDWLRKEGYAYPEGHEEEGQIDWDRVAEADIDYLSWNYDASDWFHTAKEAVEMSPTQARRSAEEGYDEEGEILKIKELELLTAHSVRMAFDRSRDGDSGLDDWIGQHIQMYNTNGKWEAKYFNPKKPTQ